MPAEKERGEQGEGELARGGKERILSYKWLCEERSAGAFSDKLPLKWRKCSKAGVESSAGRCLGCLPSSLQRGPGRGSLDSAVGDR